MAPSVCSPQCTKSTAYRVSQNEYFSGSVYSQSLQYIARVSWWRGARKCFSRLGLRMAGREWSSGNSTRGCVIIRGSIPTDRLDYWQRRHADRQRGSRAIVTSACLPGGRRARLGAGSPRSSAGVTGRGSCLSFSGSRINDNRDLFSHGAKLTIKPCW